MPDSPSITTEQMKMVLDVSRLLTVTADLDTLLLGIAEAATRLLDCERASIFLHDPVRDELWTKVALLSEPIRISVKSGISGCAFCESRVIRVDDPYADPRFNPEPDRKGGFRTRNLIAAPMLDIEHRPVGIIEGLNSRTPAFDPFDEAMIQLLADQAGVAVQRFHLQQQAMEGAKLRHEMALAREVQQALIPGHSPLTTGIESAGWTLPASITGGDTFDLWKTAAGRLGVFLGDAAGHGLAPALVVSQVRTLVRAFSDMDPDPCRILTRVNDRIAADLSPDRFVTAFLGYLAPDGALEYCSAGHGPVFLRRAPEAPLEIIYPPLPPIGVDRDGIPGVTGRARLAPGGTLVVLSDGLFEAVAPDGAMLGIPRLRNILDAHASSSPETIITALRETVRAWQTNDAPRDDQTVVVLRLA